MLYSSVSENKLFILNIYMLSVHQFYSTLFTSAKILYSTKFNYSLHQTKHLLLEIVMR